MIFPGRYSVYGPFIPRIIERLCQFRRFERRFGRNRFLKILRKCVRAGAKLVGRRMSGDRRGSCRPRGAARRSEVAIASKPPLRSHDTVSQLVRASPDVTKDATADLGKVVPATLHARHPHAPHALRAQPDNARITLLRPSCARARSMGRSTVIIDSHPNLRSLRGNGRREAREGREDGRETDSRAGKMTEGEGRPVASTRTDEFSLPDSI